MVLIISITYIVERNQFISLTINNSLEISRLHGERIGGIISKNIISLKELSKDEQCFNRGPLYIEYILEGIRSSHKYILDLNYINQDHGYVNIEVKDPYFDEELNTPVFEIIVPLINIPNSVGFLKAKMDLESIYSLTESVAVKGGSYGWITDSKGLLISHPNRDMIFTISIWEAARKGYPGFDIISKEVATAKLGYGEYYDDILKKRKIVTFSSIPNTNGWTLFITTLEEELLREINFALKRIIIISVILLILFLLIIIHYSDKITRPLKKLISAVKESQNKNFKKIDLKVTRDEVGQLITSYNNMTSEISRYTKDLEDLVEKRTKELNRLNKKLSEDNENLYNIATKDPLTGLLNRRALNQIIEQEMHRHFRYNSPVSMMIIDIDFFKHINDTYGHDVGDKVLVELADLINTYSRGSDTVSRWGGEEFLVLATHTSLEGAKIAGEKLKNVVENHNFPDDIHITISIGISTYNINESFDTWFKRSDQALYKAKTTGRNRVICL